MSDPYERVKGGRLMFKGGGVAAGSKSIDKKKKKKKSSNKIEDAGGEALNLDNNEIAGGGGDGGDASAAGGEAVYTIDAAKKMKYDELFPVEAKKFGYEPKAKFKSVEEALDDRVKKKADRYCK